MAKLPAFQFYPGDWLRDPKLMSTSYEVRGIWMQLLCYMHFEPERGVLRRPRSGILQLLGIDQVAWIRFSNAVTDYNFCGLEVDSNDVVTLRNHRMIKDEKERKQTANRQAQFRKRQSNASSHAPSNEFKRESNAGSSSSSADPDPKDLDLCSDTTLANGTLAADAAPWEGLLLPLESPEPDKLTPEGLLKAWNDICGKADLPKVKGLTSTRRKKALARIAESERRARVPGAETVDEFWSYVLSIISDSAWMRGLRPTPGHEHWRATFDWLIHDDTTALKIREGNYDR